MAVCLRAALKPRHLGRRVTSETPHFDHCPSPPTFNFFLRRWRRCVLQYILLLLALFHHFADDVLLNGQLYMRKICVSRVTKLRHLPIPSHRFHQTASDGRVKIRSCWMDPPRFGTKGQRGAQVEQPRITQPASFPFPWLLPTVSSALLACQATGTGDDSDDPG